MTIRRAAPWLVLVAVIALLGWKLHSSHFDFQGFAQSLRHTDLRLLALAIFVIYSNNIIRAMRWAVFLKPALRQAGKPPIAWPTLVGSQFIGFASLALFGRIGELIRPLLIARRTGLSFPSQVAVVTVERVFDLAAFALLFSLNLLLSPGLQSLPYLHKAGYTIAALTLILLAFVLCVRLAGAGVARLAARTFGLLSKPLAASASAKILSFRDGLNVIDSLPDFLFATGLSLALWATIAAAYVLTLKSFPAPVSNLTVADTLVLMGFSVAGSALPIPGGSGAWAGNSFALAQLFHLPQELAGGAGLLVWLVTTMAVVPAGLLFAHFEGISLTQLLRGSEAAEEQA